jgi:hypothetical protein
MTSEDEDRPGTPAERMACLQYREIPAAGRAVKATHQAWLDAIAWKDGLCDELRELAALMIDNEVGSDVPQ